MSKIDPRKLDRIKGLLESEESFPLRYTFKFIVPTKSLTKILSLFPEDENLKTRPSSKGSYISVTVVKEMSCAEDIISVYESVSVIEGVVSL